MLGGLFKQKKPDPHHEELKRLEAKRQKEIDTAYIDAKTQRRIENAKAAGARDADELLNQKPFYQKLAGGAGWLMRDLSAGAARSNPNVLFSFDDPPQRQVKRRRNRKHRR